MDSPNPEWVVRDFFPPEFNLLALREYGRSAWAGLPLLTNLQWSKYDRLHGLAMEAAARIAGETNAITQ
jgi:hypothetical protein